MAANPSKTILTYADNRYEIVNHNVLPARPLWLVPHDRMRYDYDNRSGGGWRFNPAINGKARASARLTNASKPEVYWYYPDHSTKLSDAHVQLLVGINPDLSPDKARTLLGVGLAYCNGTWGVLDKARLMGGSIITGTTSYALTQGLVDMGRLARSLVGKSLVGVKAEYQSLVSATHNILNIKTIILGDPVPSAQTVLNDITLWHWSVGVQPDGDINMWLRRGIDGNMHNVRMLNISRLPIYYRLDELYKLPDGFTPNAQWMPQS